MKQDIQEWLVGWFADHTGKTKDEILAHTAENYFDIGFIDSFGFVELIEDLEEKCGLRFSNDAFEDRDFAAIDGLVKIIRTMDGQG